MSDEQESGGKSFKWGGLVKGILAGAAIIGGIALMSPSLVSGALSAIGGAGAAGGGQLFGAAAMEGIGTVIRIAAGAVLTGVGLSNLLGSSEPDNNAQRHAEQYNEARESFAIREDMRKMQAVMMMRMKASGHEPALAMAQQGR